MAARLTSQRYGKHRVRVSKIRRPRNEAANRERHEFVEVTVDVELAGDFDAAYLGGDNRSIIATDTCKNTVYVVAQDDDLTNIESFGVALAEHFIDNYGHVGLCRVALRERVWERLLESPHAFVGQGQSTPTALVELSRGDRPRVVAGIDGLLIAKTTESGFANFHDSKLRTLADTDDRIMATCLTAEWTYLPANHDFANCRNQIAGALLARFIDHYSRSVQETLFLMAQAALDSCHAVSDITLTMPNKHHLLANLTPFGRENDNEVFVVTDEPFGFITATVTRA